MPYDINISEREGHLRAELSGKRVAGRTTEDALDFWRQVAEICIAQDIHRVLCVAQLYGPLPAVSSYEAARSLGDMGLRGPCRIAYVDLNEETLPTNLFAETVAINRGVEARVFGNEDDAMTWLFEI